MRMKTFFQLSHLIFCNLNIAKLSTINVEMHGGAGCSISDGCRDRGDRVRTQFFNSPWQARSMDMSRSTGTHRATPHFYGNGKQAREGVVVIWVCGASSEGVVVGMVSGLADACVFMVV